MSDYRRFFASLVLRFARGRLVRSAPHDTRRFVVRPRPASRWHIHHPNNAVIRAALRGDSLPHPRTNIQ